MSEFSPNIQIYDILMSVYKYFNQFKLDEHLCFQCSLISERALHPYTRLYLHMMDSFYSTFGNGIARLQDNAKMLSAEAVQIVHFYQQYMNSCFPAACPKPEINRLMILCNPMFLKQNLIFAV